MVFYVNLYIFLNLYIGVNSYLYGYYNEAIAYINKALTYNENDDIYLSNLGRCYFKLKNYEESYKWLKKAIEINESHDSTNAYYGMILFEFKNYSESMIYLHKCLSIDDDYEYLVTKSKLFIAKILNINNEFIESIELCNDILNRDDFIISNIGYDLYCLLSENHFVSDSNKSLFWLQKARDAKSDKYQTIFFDE